MMDTLFYYIKSMYSPVLPTTIHDVEVQEKEVWNPLDQIVIRKNIKIGKRVYVYDKTLEVLTPPRNTNTFEGFNGKRG